MMYHKILGFGERSQEMTVSVFEGIKAKKFVESSEQICEIWKNNT